ncbi:nucleotidyl transferase AbiEii/AbiGii toxin family protein [Chitinophaga sp. sic0106]|uniref:nucleotidyl transferase AbiEii/AbiGii toxin family protein n=1 Tax=Chitinophaga sp. sic0106 TaxID=2854785 RepID=UPI001C45A6B3|nr:nucleotidyl transferase AbiEii/AbiGii toxin family protein [Chitinophaga sp. sic0106]MBV7530623.1 nucleotidyl transferase AbiEii/AbiGii toxin family protein [Chitinophaga sp. sic0106]
MLRKETVSESTLELLKSLMKDEHLQDFFLVGGTALALLIGHRISIDLDLFTIAPFNEDAVLTELETNYSFQLDFQARNTIKGRIQEVKVDLITHAYPLVQPLTEEEGVRMASLKDIAAMKLNAITGNGTRLKDFIDIAYLSAYLPLADMLEAYSEKYSSRNPIMVLKALDYHNDIDFKEPIMMLDGEYSWKKIKGRLDQMTLHPQKLFSSIF